MVGGARGGGSLVCAREDDLKEPRKAAGEGPSAQNARYGWALPQQGLVCQGVWAASAIESHRQQCGLGWKGRGDEAAKGGEAAEGERVHNQSRIRRATQ